MKIHSRKTDGKRHRQKTKKKAEGHPAATFFAVLLFVAVIGFIISTKQVEYKSRTEELTEYISKAERELKQIKSEISYLEIEKEALTTRKHIYAKVSQFKLGLKEASPRQLCSLNSRTNNNTRYARTAVSGRSVAYLQQR